MVPVFDHVSLTVSDVERSIAFYVQYFGFKEARRDKLNFGHHVDALAGVPNAHLIAAFVTNGSLTLEFVEFKSPKGQRAMCAPMNEVGAPHLGFVVENVRAEYDRLKDLGVTFIAPPVFNSNRNTYSVMLRDPDGIPLELRETPALKTPAVA